MREATMDYLGKQLLSKVIAQTFEKEVGRGQFRREGPPKALKVSFSTRTDNEEEGYRSADLVLFAGMNYVGVYVRDCWDVIPVEHLGYDEDLEDTYVKPGHAYVKGESPWKVIGYHDSCWRDSVEKFLAERWEDILTFRGPGSWFEVVDVTTLNLPDPR
jgi:hypothetical protein